MAVAMIAAPKPANSEEVPHYQSVIQVQIESWYSDDLNRYLMRIRPEYDSYYAVISRQRFFNEFKGLTLEQQIDDFERYFPLYYAAELEYQIPWEMMWIAHEQETVASRHGFPTEGFQMGMQRNEEYYSLKDVLEASRKYDFLQLWQGQRYTSNLGPGYTYDYQEILWAASKMRDNAETILELNPGMSWEEAVMSAQYSYCAPFCAAERNAQYLRIVYRLEQELANYLEELEPAGDLIE